MLANRQVFRETEYGSDVFMNNRMSSILLSSHEKNLKGFIGHWYDRIINFSPHIHGLDTMFTGLMTVTVRLILLSKRSNLRTPTSRSSRSTTECLSGTTSVALRAQWLAREATEPWSARNPFSMGA